MAEENTTVSLNTPEDQPTVSLSGKPFNVPSPSTATLKAAKTYFALGDTLEQSHEDIFARISNGGEDSLRKLAAAKIDVDKSEQRQKLLTQVAAQAPDAVSLAKDKQFMSQLTGLPEPTDPNSVVEEYFAGKYMQPWLSDFVQPQEKEAVDHGVTNLTYKNYALKALQEMIEVYNRQGYFGPGVEGGGIEKLFTGWIGDQAKMLSQVYLEKELRGGWGKLFADVIHGMTGEGHLLGTQLEEDRFGAYAKPMDEYKKFIDEHKEMFKNDNPAAGLIWLSAMVGQSYEDIATNNKSTITGGLMDAANVIGGAGAVAQGIAKARAAVQSAVKSTSLMDDYVTRMKGINERANMVTDIPPENYTSPQDIKAAQASGEGKLGEAAVQQTTTEINSVLTNKQNPVNQVVKTMPDLWKGNTESMLKDPGNTGAEKTNRLIEHVEQRKVDIARIGNDIQKVNRTPPLTVSEDLARMLDQWMRNKYSGNNSSVLNVGRELIYDQPSNTYHASIDIGTANAEYLPTEAHVIDFADNIGIPLWEPEKGARQYWDDRITAKNFQREEQERIVRDYESRYTKQQFKPTKYYTAKETLERLKNEINDDYRSRAIAYWRPDVPMPQKLGRWTMENAGKGWYIQAWVPVDETAPFMRDGLLKIPGQYSGSVGGVFSGGLTGKYRERIGSLTPYLIDPMTGVVSTRLLDIAKVYMDSATGLADPNLGLLHGIRIPDETMSPQENVQRKIATFGPSKLADALFKEDAQKLQDLAAIDKKLVADLKRVLIKNQNMIGPNSADHGYFYQSVGELEHAYDKINGRLPIPQETDAYFAYTRMIETERGLRTLLTYNHMARLGIEQFTIDFGGNKGETDPFHGRIIKELPPQGGGNSVFVRIKGKEKVKGTNSWTQEEKDGIEKGTLTLIQLWNRELRPLHPYSMKLDVDTEPNYILTDSIKGPGPIDPNLLVPKRMGGHWGFDYPWYMKIPNTRFDKVTKRWLYKGDITAFPFKDRATGERVMEKLNYIREMIHEGKTTDAAAYFNAAGFHDLDFFKDVLPWFREGRGPKGERTPARFPTHEKFELVPVNSTIPGVNKDFEERYKAKGGIIDTTRQGNLARNNVVEYTQPRDAWDLHTIEDEGTARNPVYKYRPAELIDPIDMLDRSIMRLSNQMFTDDMKAHTVEHWVETYKPWLKATEDELRDNPYRHFLYPEWKEGVAKKFPQVIPLAMSNRKKAMDFVNMPSPVQSAIKSMLGAAIGKDADIIRPLGKMMEEHNPIRAVRGMAANWTLGMFSPVAFHMQLSAYMNIYAFAPRSAPAATAAMLFHQWSRFIPEHVDHLDKILSKLNFDSVKGIGAPEIGPRAAGNFHGWRPGWFKEANDFLANKTDFARVGKEHAESVSGFNDGYMKSNWETVKYWGMFPFREGAQAVRIGAWYTSYLNHRMANPTKVFGRLDWEKVLNDAADWDHNMNRSSNSALNSGIMAVPFQFNNYPRNMAEAVLGKRYDAATKARLIGITALLWGLPAGSIGYTMLPLAKKFREYMMDPNNQPGKYLPGLPHGYVPGANYWTWIMEGLVNRMLESYTGRSYNTSKFGVQGSDAIGNIMGDARNWWDMLGAAPSWMHRAFESAGPIWGDIAAAMNKDWDKFRPKLTDLTDLLKFWQAYSLGSRLWMQITTGATYSNNHSVLETGVTNKQAFIGALMGLTSTDISDIGIREDMLKARKQFENDVQHEMGKMFNLALIAQRDCGTAERCPEYNDYMTKAKALGEKLTAEQRIQVWERLYKRNKPLVESLKEELGTGMGSTPADFEKYIQEKNLESK